MRNDRSQPPGKDLIAPAREVRRFSSILLPLLLAIASIVFIFGLYEIVERTWLRDVEMRVIHMGHIVRGVVSSLVAAFAVGWSVLRASPPLLALEPAERELEHGLARSSDLEKAAHYARWFIQMRWIAVLAAATLVFVAVRITHLLPTVVFWPLALTVAALAAINGLWIILVRRGKWRRHILTAQIYGDLAILTILLHFSGGIENALSLLFLLHVIIGGILLSRRQCYEVAVGAGAFLALLAWLEWAGLVDHYTLLTFPHGSHGHQHAAHDTLFATSNVLLHWGLLFLVAYFITTLAERARSHEEQLEAMADHARAERRLLEQALETTGTGLRVLDPDLQPRWINRLWTNWFGKAGPVGGGGGEGSPMRQTLRDGMVQITEFVSPRAGEHQGAPGSSGGEQRVYQVTTAPLPRGGDDPSDVVELAQDITEQKRAEARMMQAGKMAAVGELAGHVAHEVNNPIAIISAKARLLLSDRRDEMSDKTAEDLDKIIDLSDRVARIAQGLLSYCRPSTGTRTPVDIRKPIHKALSMVEQHAKTAGIKIEEQLADKIPIVEANANEMEQVFLNLFLNAIDAMPKGGSLRISTDDGEQRLADGRRCLAIVVEDTGCGITEEIRQRVFEPFFTTKAEGRGTGLGLSICDGVVRSHGGEMDVEDGPGQGACFIVRLPVERSAGEEQAKDG